MIPKLKTWVMNHGVLTWCIFWFSGLACWIAASVTQNQTGFWASQVLFVLSALAIVYQEFLIRRSRKKSTDVQSSRDVAQGEQHI